MEISQYYILIENCAPTHSLDKLYFNKYFFPRRINLYQIFFFTKEKSGKTLKHILMRTKSFFKYFKTKHFFKHKLISL